MGAIARINPILRLILRILVRRRERAIAVNCVYHLNIGTKHRRDGKEPSLAGTDFPA